MKTVSPEFVRELIDFAPSGDVGSEGFGEMQLEGAVAAYNMLARNRIAYLADEVGMGKTYVALGVMGLVRYMNPLARIVVIAPRENIQRKWIKELSNFIRLNWKVVGHRVKSLQGGPVWEPVYCNALRDFMREVSLNANRDFFLRMTSFSLALKDVKARRSLRRELKRMAPWAANDGLAARTVEGFRDAYGCSLNAVIPPIDLLVIDEAHNLKHGFGPRVSTRNRILGLGLGHPEGGGAEYPWYGRRPQHVLVLSATPFEEDYGAIHRQFDVLGFGDAAVRDAEGRDPVALRDLADPEIRELEKREIVSRLMLRRVAGIQIAGSKYTKNMYRREWRSGGLESHDEPVRLERPEQRLVVALMQKKVAEVLQHERFNNSFQIGMLSSFESFLESLGRTQRKATREETQHDEETASFDGQQDATLEEKRGIDTQAIIGIVQSYRDRFGESLPHPKLDITAETLDDVFDTGEKALVFVRRVATVEELAAKLDASFDRWIRARMHDLLPDLGEEIDRIFATYEQDRARRPEEDLHPSSTAEEPDEEALARERSSVDEVDDGGSETFFSWFFRGAGPPNVLSGAAFQKNRLSSASAAYATLFEDEHVAWLLGRPDDVIGALSDAVGQPRTQVVRELRRRAYDHFRGRTQQQEGYPRLYVFQAYQAVALEMLEAKSSQLGERAGIVIRERYPETASREANPPRGFPPPGEALGIDTFFTELAKRPVLGRHLWPDEANSDFREQFRRREQRRELLSALARLGAPYIDLYGLAMRPLGSFEPRRQTEVESPDARLGRDFADLLEKQMVTPGYHSFHELSSVAGAFDVLIAVNFPEVPNAPLKDAARIYGATLQRQVPIGRMSGGVNKRLVRQFRMPGFPLVLVTTDVLQEGEDLHTFCKRVVHYGISWTPSAMEQRTGRVDRIGGLVQRQLDGRPEVPRPDEWIQVHYPHLQDTVEVLQIRRVFTRMNRFLQLIHKTDGWDDEQDSRIDAGREFLEEWQNVAPISTALESAFPVREEWLAGEVQAGAFRAPELEPHLSHLDELWQELRRRLPIETQGRPEARTRGGTLNLSALPSNSRGGSRLQGTQRFELELRSQAAGDAVLLRCTSVVGEIDPNNPAVLDQLYDVQQALDIPKICTRPNARTHLAEVSLQGGILFHPDTTQIEELESLLLRTVVAAAGVDTALADIESEITRPTGRLRGKASEETLAYIDDLIRQRDLPWTRSQNVIDVHLASTGRGQRVRIEETGRSYVFRSRVAGSSHVRSTDEYWRDLAYRAWCRNAEKDLVTFGFDLEDQLIGLIRQPIDTTDDEELILYIQALAAECDRFEYVATGEDAN